MTERLTVGEIAERIREPSESLQEVVNRVRSWSKEGLLKPVEKRGPGTGRHLHYPERVILDAAILSKLARHYGIWAVRLQHCDSALEVAARQIPLARDFFQNGELLYLTIGVLYKDDKSAVPSEILSEIQLVNIKNSRAKPHERLSNKFWHPHRYIRVPDLLEFGIVINLTSLIKRLKIPHSKPWD